MQGGFGRSVHNAAYYKNMYLGASYLYAVAEGRAHYGTLGWNVYSGFDLSDFEISAR